MPRHCLTLGLRPDPALIADYIESHRHVPAPIQQSLRDAGILAMEIYEHNAQLFMVIDTTEDFTFARKAEMDRNNPAVLAWEQQMARFQNVSASADPVTRWQPTRRVFKMT